MKKFRVMLVNCIHAKGGAERFTSLLLKHLCREKFDLSLCLFWRRPNEYPIPKDVPVHCLEHPQTRFVNSLTQESSVKDKILFRVERLRLLNRRRRRKYFEEHLAQEQPDVVLSILERPGILVGETIKTMNCGPVWVSRCGNNPRHSFRGWEGQAWLKRLRRVIDKADYWVANSQGLTEHCNDFYPGLKGKARTLFNFVDVDTIAEAAEREQSEQDLSNCILCLARLVRQKRFDILLKAFRKVVDQNPTCRLLILGEGPERPRIEALRERLSLESNVVLLGRVHNPFVLLKRTQLLVSASEYEGLPNSMLEAQSLGIPVVATDCEFGVSEVVAHGKTGLLSQTGEHEGLANNILKLLGDEELRKEMGREAQRRTQEIFALDSVISSWEDLLVEAGSLRGERTR